ncbi:MAG: lamin tail domain-containing protein [Planctomycetes bacterium]|nr:lamin tail domain-containing protein [Planctomycetota bacterium]
MTRSCRATAASSSSATAVLGLDFTARYPRFAALVAPDATHVADALNLRLPHRGMSGARIPEGGPRLSEAADPTPGAANSESVERDVVLNEVMYHPMGGGLDGEYVELHNVGSRNVDVSGWRFSEGIDFVLPPGTRIPPGGYLVVARDPERIRRLHGLPGEYVLGPGGDAGALYAFGRLEDHGEHIVLLDALDRVVDEVEYSSGGEWPAWAAGGGSSLELIDPRAENAVPQAWDASDDAAKAAPATFTYRGRFQGGPSELHVVLPDRGIALVDEISVRPAGDGPEAELIQNGGFEADGAGWTFDGNHGRSGRTAEEPIEGAASLKVIAAGPGDHRANGIQTPGADGAGLGALPAGEDVEVSLVARWRVGSRTLLTFAPGHSLAKAHELPVPRDLGTPGRENSVTRRLAARLGSADLGPVIWDARQEPAAPEAGEPVTITARVADPDGAASVEVRYAFGGPSDAPESASMAEVEPGLYRGAIPGQARGATIAYHVAAADGGGRAGRYPADRAARTHPSILDPARATPADRGWRAYRHVDRDEAGPLDDYRFVLTPADEARLFARKLHDDEPIEGALVVGRTRLHHGGTIRFDGGPWERPRASKTYRVVLAPDGLLQGRVAELSIEDHDARARLVQHVHSHLQTTYAGPHSEAFARVRWRLGGRPPEARDRVWVPDARFVAAWFPGDDDGDLVAMGPEPPPGLRHPPPGDRGLDGEDKESYRWFFTLRAHAGEDYYRRLIELARILDPEDTRDATLEANLPAHMHVEQVLRGLAVNLNIDAREAWGASGGTNTFLYRPPVAGIWHALTWGIDDAFGDVRSFLVPEDPAAPYEPGPFAEVNRLLNVPRFKRLTYAVLSEMVNGSGGLPPRFHSSFLAPYVARLEALGMTGTAAAKPGGFVDQRNGLLRERLRSVSYPQVRLAITTNGGEDFTTSETTVDLAGAAPVEAAYVLVARAGEVLVDYQAQYPSLTTWAVPSVPLEAGKNNALDVFGFDLQGNLVDHDAIAVTVPVLPPVISELRPAEAAAGEDIAVLGSGFRQGLRVFFGAAESPSVFFSEVQNPGSIGARVPEGRGTVLVTVRNSDGGTSEGKSFTYAPRFIRGDADSSGGLSPLNLTDAVVTLRYLFQGGDLDCLDAADSDDSGAVDITDPIVTLRHLFLGGSPPPAPYPSPGKDPTPDGLGCG